MNTQLVDSLVQIIVALTLEENTLLQEKLLARSIQSTPGSTEIDTIIAAHKFQEDDPLALLRESDFVGCFSGSPDLSDLLL